MNMLFRALALGLLIGQLGCVSVTLTPRAGTNAGRAGTPLLVLVNQGGYDLQAATDLKDELILGLREQEVAAEVLVVTSEELKRQDGIEHARTKSKSLLRIMPIAGTHLEAVATRITYDVSLHETASDKRLWQARLEVRSGILSRQLARRQRRAAHAIVDALVDAGAI